MELSIDVNDIWSSVFLRKLYWDQKSQTNNLMNNNSPFTSQILNETIRPKLYSTLAS